MNLLQILLKLLGLAVASEDPIPAAIQGQAQKEALAAKEKTWTLIRTAFRDDGIFSDLLDENGNLLAKCLEHSFNLQPIITNGSHVCVRGNHRLHGMTEDFSTFEVTGIAGHTGLLIHWGNWNKDSDGCILVGQTEILDSMGHEMVTGSKVEFAKLMALLDGINEFVLEVS